MRSTRRTYRQELSMFHCFESVRWSSLLLISAAFLCGASATRPLTRPIIPSSSIPLTRASLSCWGKRSCISHRPSFLKHIDVASLRGGAVEEYDEYDDEEYDDEYDDEEDEESEAEEGVDETDGVQIEVNVEKYDEPLVASPMLNLYATFGVMMLARRVDLFSPTVVRIARFAYIAYLIGLQLFLLYVRVKAKSINDRTPITLKNPLSSVLQSQLGQGDGGNSMMKDLASSFLSSKSTVLEYDLKQAKNMQSGLIFSMAFMWFLHFKMEQVQPLIIQTFTGLLNMMYSPLFQVYVLGRNLERPFKNPAMKKMEDAAAASAELKEAEQIEEEAIEAEAELEVVDAAIAIESSEESSDEEEVDENEGGEDEVSSDEEEEQSAGEVKDVNAAGEESADEEEDESAGEEEDESSNDEEEEED